MYRTANAMLIRFRWPTASAAKAAVSASPTSRVISAAAMSRPERKPAYRIRPTMISASAPAIFMPPPALRSSSSDIGTKPVRRTPTPSFGVSPRLSARVRMRVSAGSPGKRRSKSRRGRISM